MTVNKKQKEIIKKVNQAFSKLHVLSNITWSPYRDVLFDLNKKDEKQHRFNRPLSDFETSINDCAKMFTVKHLAESLLNISKWKVKDLLIIKKSCIYAQAVVENYRDVIVTAWKDEDIKYLASLDYISLINWDHYTEQQQRRVA
jgi:hypothetical protein